MVPRPCLAAAGAAAVLAVAASAAAGGTAPSLSISTPRAGASVSAKRAPYLAIAGSAQFAPADATDTTFYLRRDGCGTPNDNPHLSVTSGTDAGDGCGLTLTVVGVGGDVDQGAYVDYPTSDGMPLAFDASRNVTGAIDLESFSVNGAGAAGGLVELDVSLEALVGGNGVDAGTDTEQVLVTPGQSDYQVPFTIRPSSSLAGVDGSGLDLRIHLHGPYAFSGFIGNSGKSWLGVPSYAASVNRSVEISLDDPSFADPVPARLSSADGSWSVAVPTPDVGSHTVYAEATQGFDTSSPASTSFKVSK